MTAQFHAKPEMVQLTECGAARVPHGSAWMIFDVDSVAPSCTHPGAWLVRSEEHTSELQSQSNLVCRLLLEKKKKQPTSLRRDWTLAVAREWCTQTIVIER